MGNCKNVCRLCNRMVLSDGITFTGGNLVINLPSGDYLDGTKYCIVLADAIPATTTIYAPVVFTIDGGAVLYPLVNRCCRPVTACGVRTRTKYSVVMETTATGGTFKMLGNPCCQPNNNLRSVNGTAPTTETETTIP